MVQNSDFFSFNELYANKYFIKGSKDAIFSHLETLLFGQQKKNILHLHLKINKRRIYEY